MLHQSGVVVYRTDQQHIVGSWGAFPGRWDISNVALKVMKCDEIQAKALVIVMKHVIMTV
jgi:hypothetical protein